MYNKTGYEEIEVELNKKGYKTTAQSCIRLINHLIKKNIEDDKLKEMFDELLENITDYHNGDKNKKKPLRTKYYEIINYAKKEYKFIQKGTTVGAYMAMFSGVGVAFGAALATINIAFMGFGIPIGVALGLAIGTDIEKKAEKEDRLF